MKNKGFSLVELIVVIAIMAILVGVAVPVYTSYIEKANAAKDEQLLGEINSAFAIVLASNAIDINTVTEADIPVNDGVVNLDGMTVNGEENTAIENAMISILGTDLEFAVIEDIWYNSKTHKFVDNALVEYTVGNNTVYLTAEQVALFRTSTYAQIGGQALLGEIQSLTDLVGGEGFDAEALLTNEAYMRSFASYLGVENADKLTPEQLSDEINKAAENMGGLSDEAMVNGLVYWAAENSSDMNSEDVTELLNSGNIYSNLSSDPAEKMAQASMIYGMYTSYVNSDFFTGNDEDIETDPITITQTVGSDPNFTAYVNSQQGQSDMEAYMAAMGVICDSTSNKSMTADVLNNGFDNPELADLLAEVLGK